MSPFVIPIVGMLIPIIIVPVSLSLKHARYARELEHRERMRAIELGRSMPGEEPAWSLPKLCLSIGGGVPFSAFLFAWLATQAVGFQELIWAMAGAVAITAVICGTILSVKHFHHVWEQEALARSGYFSAKPVMEEDAYDVAGARG